MSGAASRSGATLLEIGYKSLATDYTDKHGLEILIRVIRG